MDCIQCGHKTRIINSRAQRRNNSVWRRHKCLNCGLLFTTGEECLYELTWLVKDTDGHNNPFSKTKLLISLYRSCEHRASAYEDAKGLTDTVIQKVRTLNGRKIIPSYTIAQSALTALSRFDSAASVHYASRHSLKSS